MSVNKFIETITSGKKYSLEEQSDLNIKGPKAEPQVPVYLQSPKAWKNYTNQALYDAEVALRKWFDIKMKDENWKKNRFARRYKCSMLIEEIFGRPYDQKIDGKYTMMYARLFGHYSSRVTKTYWNPKTQKTQSLSAYHISLDRIKKAQAYSIKLRVEDLIAKGEIPNVYNTRPAKEIETGHCRRKLTRERQDRRIQKSKEAYERNHSKK